MTSKKNAPKIPIINDDPASDKWAFPTGARLGMTGRDLRTEPLEMFAPPSEIQVIPASEYADRIDEQEREQSSLEHIYLDGNWENLDQNGDGYCWSYSLGHALMLNRVRDGLPFKRLNPHSTAAIVKGGRDEGGWCGLSAKFARETGMTVEGAGPGQWPLHSRSLSHDNAACRAMMAKYESTEDYVDLTRDVYDQNLTLAMVYTMCLMNNPCQVDFNWWGHSVCAIRLVKVEAGSFGLLILNSWKEWGRRGLGILQGSKAIPNGSVCQRSSVAA